MNKNLLNEKVGGIQDLTAIVVQKARKQGSAIVNIVYATNGPLILGL